MDWVHYYTYKGQERIMHLVSCKGEIMGFKRFCRNFKLDFAAFWLGNKFRLQFQIYKKI